MKKLTTLLGILLLSVTLFASQEGNAIFTIGTTTEHGDFVVVNTDDIYHFQGEEYKVYNVMYDDPTANMKIAVNGKKYIVYNSEVVFIYKCTRQGFGVRKVLFNNPEVMKKYDAHNFSNQMILCKGRKIDDETAMGLIAAFVPKLKVSDV